MRRNWLSLLGLLMVLVLGAAACGGDDGGGGESSSSSGNSEEESSDDTVPEDEWAEEAASLCEDWAEEFGELDGSDGDEVTEFSETTATFAEEVEGLGEPRGIGDEASAFVDAVTELGDVLAQAGEELEEDDEISDETDEAGPEATDAVLEAAEDLELDCDLSILESDSSDDLTSDFSDDTSSDFSDDFSSDFSDDFSDDPVDAGEALDPTIFIPEYGTDPELDALADDCYNGDFAACDGVYLQSPPSDSTGSYEGYGATCGGRLAEENPGACQVTFG